jgi:cephalosporin hydroxylase
MKRRFDYYYPRILGTPLIRHLVIDSFNVLSYGAPGMAQYWATDISWMGVRVLKNPIDLWYYQQIVYAVRPDAIIESGTGWGGSAYYLACLCDLLGNGQVITVDIQPKENRPVHQRISYLTGSSTSDLVLQQVKEKLAGKERVMVILDSDHSKDHVLRELNLYHAFVTPNSYLIVEDTIVNGHPIITSFGPGPDEAVKQFLGENPDFIVDRFFEKTLTTFNPGGYLKRKSPAP